MGQPKQLLPWGDTTVLGQVVRTFATGLSSEMGMEYELLVVTGAWREPVEAEVFNLAKSYPVRAIYNAGYRDGGMLGSIQTGLAALGKEEAAALIGLGDQPQVEQATIRSICATFLQDRAELVIPSYEGHRGHPWLAARPLWSSLLTLSTSTTPRHFLNLHAREIQYVSAGASILQDLDTPQEYQRQRP